MESQADTPSSQSVESYSLDLPTASDFRGPEAAPAASQGASSKSLSSLESHSFPCSSTADPDSSSLNTEQKDSWDSENFWLDPSAKGQLETSEEEDGLRKSLDRFYEAFAHPLPGSGDRLSAQVCQCLSQAVSELEGQESQKYTLRSFQMARVIFSRDGCSILQRHSRQTRFYPLEQGGNSLESEEPTPGLSREIVHFLLEQSIMKDS
ncbi:shieldin complex subunit 1 [Arvicola amphibius]|uniref:shieldin complex subunit 1 n=1 Tax=Arvicola amphibius TaxID=1047088 RepID=UPI0018E33D30|nr:shieldin complex subunit 1 [Arvicola amphibius]XP_038187996.1 shieldin complex subunit 1 [Arvicola amphibius]XP_038187997.1 shieldin complex subunit 1 [Arvicola amphibius]XP_038187998.1 shieldin complex subunit 1 [Arvicola amphibius]